MTDIDWGDLDAPKNTVEVLAEELAKLQADQKSIKEQIEIIETKLATEFDEDPGEYSLRVGNSQIECKISEVWQWDSDQLDSLFASTTLPAHIKKKLSVDKRMYQALDEDEQEEIKPALTRKPGKPKFKIFKIGEDE